MSDLEDIAMAFESYGYERQNGLIVASRGDMWYRHKSSTETIEHFAYLSYKPRVKAFDVTIGVVNSKAHQSVKAALPIVGRLIDPGYLATPFLIERPCWHMFNAGRGLNWDSVYVMPNPKDRSGWPILFESLCQDFIEPFFLSIDDLAGIQNLLFRNDPPFEWFGSNPVLRFGEIIALAKEQGWNRKYLADRLRELRSIVTGDEYSGTADRLIDELIIFLF
jgi:hypothetical protein